MNKNLKI